MRPVRLEIQGFTCYREKQEIDFNQLGLFAIAGPTGAGKSSILDAIAFALYGEIPRMGGQNLDEFVSLGAPRASVLFEFDIQNERYRVARSMLRSGAKKAQLEQISNGSQKALCDGVREVNLKLEAILGLKFNAFIQSVLLPQGEFSKFLKSTPSEQRQILRELLCLGIYERMRERAHAQARDLAGEIKTARELLEGPYVHATPQNVAQLEADLNTLTSKKAAAADELNKRKQHLEMVKAHWNLIEERQNRDKQLKKLDQDRPRICTLKAAIERAKQAVALLPMLDDAVAKLKAWKDIKQELEGLEKNLDATNKIAVEREQKLSEARKRADTLPGKRFRLMDLNRIQPVLRERKATAAHCEKARGELKKAERAIAEQEKGLERAEAAVLEKKKELEQIDNERSKLGYDAAIHEIFKRAAIIAHDLTQTREQSGSLDPSIVQTAVQNAETAAQKAAKALVMAQAEYERTEEKTKAAQQSLETLQETHKAASLRHGLTPGCTCPVCEQRVTVIPRMETVGDLDKARSVLASLKKSSEHARKAAEGARDIVTRTQADLENAKKNALQWKAEAERFQKRVDVHTKSLVNLIKPFESPAGVSIDEFVAGEFARLEKIHRKWFDLEKELNRVTLAVHRAQAERDKAKTAVETEKKTKLRLQSEIAEAEVKLTDYDEQISTVSSHDPEKELESLQAEISEIEKQFQEASEQSGKAKAAAHEVELRATEVKGRLSSTEKEKEAAQAFAENVLRDANFTDSNEARKAGMKEEAIAAGTKEIETFEQRIQQTQARIQELNNVLTGVVLTEADVHRETDEAQKAENNVLELERQIGSMIGELKRLEADTQKAERLRADYEARRSRHALFQQLSQDLRGDCFQQYLLDGSFRRLVAGASTRLRQLNDRYELAFADGKFTVVDHDHGSLHRLADTLSGGETFLVSLALALELSEQVQQAAGAVRLDSLFIDEGFGTLDPETLDTVADAIESLSKTNRMVGIITHVAELHRRLPRLEVRPTASGSIVQYVED